MYRGRCRLRKTEKIFSANNEQSNMKRGESGFLKTMKNCDLENFLSESFFIRTSKGRTPASELGLLWRGLPSEIALQGGSLESKIVYHRGVDAAQTSKSRKNFFGSK